MRFAPVGQIPRWLEPVCATLRHPQGYLSKNSKRRPCRASRWAKWSNLKKSRISSPSCALQPAIRLPAKPLAFAEDQHRHSAIRFGYFALDRDFALAVEKVGYIDAINPDLSRFKARGGKLLIYHGWADPGPAPQNTINYYSAVQQKIGGTSDDWMRLFLLPRVGHCGGGVGPD